MFSWLGRGVVGGASCCGSPLERELTYSRNLGEVSSDTMTVTLATLKVSPKDKEEFAMQKCGPARPDTSRRLRASPDEWRSVHYNMRRGRRAHFPRLTAAHWPSG